METLKDKIAIVTGAASGIGLGITRTLIAEGASVAMLDIDPEPLNKAAAALDKTGAKVQAYTVDVTNREQMQEAASAIQQRFGSIHVLCNNAGVAIGGAVDEVSYEMWDWALEINLKGVVNGMQTFLPLINAETESGHIVNTASILSQFPIAGQSIYCASKYAVLGLSEVARIDLAPKNIGVSVLCPGLIATNVVKSIANRSKNLGGGGGQSAELDEIDKVYQAKGLSPDIVGNQVVAGIKSNSPYIFTDTDQVEAMKERFATILSCFDQL